MSWIWKFFKFLWSVLNFIRRMAVGVFVLLILGMIALSMMPTHKPVIEGGSLLLNPWGNITDHDKVDTSRGLSDFVGGRSQVYAPLRDIVGAIEKAKDDDRIKNIVLDLGYMGYAGLAQLDEIAKALQGFRDAGKKVYAYGDYFSQGQYYLAAQADEVYMNPGGVLPLYGFGTYPDYYLDAINELELNVHVFRVGTFKSAVEPFLRRDMSPEAKKSAQAWLDDLWGNYLDGVARGRGLDASKIRDYIEKNDEHMKKAKGDFGVAAKDAGLLTDLKTFAEFNRYMIGIVGGEERRMDKYEVFNYVDYRSYMEDVRSPSKSDNRIAVIVAEGELRPGPNAEGIAGSASIVRKLQAVEADDRYKAVVLRVNSPGGSVFASEEIRQAVLEVKKAGKPVIASFGHMAASGGYWISMSTDEIWAAPSTITGSIGVFAVLFKAPNTLKKIGIQSDGVGTTPFSDANHLGRKMPEQMQRVMQSSVEHTYDQFISIAAKTRGIDKDKMDQLAQGRVWSGMDAKRHGLVDSLGSFEDAVEAAAKKVSIQGDYSVDYVDQEYDFWSWFFGEAEARIDYAQGNYLFGQLSYENGGSTLAQLWESVQRSPLNRLVNNDPRHVYAHCMCEVKQ